VQRFLARQPIFNSALIAYGCDLLFRSGPENRHDFLHEGMASAFTADNILLFGTAGSTTCAAAFLNCMRDFLIRDFATMLPKDRMVLEILKQFPWAAKFTTPAAA
jgi:c-di-GMP-related signal transduction protein